MKTLLISLLFSLAAFGEELRVTATPLLTQANPIAQFIPMAPNAKPGWMVTVQRMDGGALTADAYRVTLRFSKDGAEYERTQMFTGEGKDHGGVLFYVEGALVSAAVVPVWWDTFKVSEK